MKFCLKFNEESEYRKNIFEGVFTLREFGKIDKCTNEKMHKGRRHAQRLANSNVFIGYPCL